MKADSSFSNRGFLARDIGYQPANLLGSSQQEQTGSRSNYSHRAEDSVHKELDSIIDRVNTLIQFTNRAGPEQPSREFKSGSDVSQQIRASDSLSKTGSRRQSGLEPDVSFSEKPASSGTLPSANSPAQPKSAPTHSADLQCAESTHTLQSGANGTDLFSMSTLPARWPAETGLAPTHQGINSVLLRSQHPQNLQPPLLQGSLPRGISQTDGGGSQNPTAMAPCFSGLQLVTKSQRLEPSHRAPSSRPTEAFENKENSPSRAQAAQAAQAMKLNEIVSRLKYISKTNIGCVQVLVSLLKDAVLADAGGIGLLCALGRAVPKALARLQTSTTRSDKVLKQLDSQRLEGGVLADILAQLGDTLKCQTRELLESVLSEQRGAGQSQKGSSQASQQSKSSRSKSPMSRRSDGLGEQPARGRGSDRPAEQELRGPAPRRSEAFDFARAPGRPGRLPVSDGFEAGDDGTPQATLLSEQKFSFKACASCRSKKSFVVGFEDGAVSVMSLSESTPVRARFDRCFRAGTDAVTQILHLARESEGRPSRDLLVLSVGRRDPTLVFYSLHQDKIVREEKAHSQLVSGLVQVSERLFISASIDKSIKVWDAETMLCVNTQYLHDSPIISSCFSPELSLFASGDLSGYINLLCLETEDGRLKSCCFYRKFKACGPVLELLFDPFKRLVSFENSRMRVYDCRGTLFKDVRCQYFVNSARFLGNQFILLVDITGRPTVIDYEQSLCDNSLPKPLQSGQADEIEMASHSISHRITGLLAKGGFVSAASGSLVVFSVSFDSGSLLLHDLPLQPQSNC